MRGALVGLYNNQRDGEGSDAQKSWENFSRQYTYIFRIISNLESILPLPQLIRVSLLPSLETHLEGGVFTRKESMDTTVSLPYPYPIPTLSLQYPYRNPYRNLTSLQDPATAFAASTAAFSQSMSASAPVPTHSGESDARR